MERTTQPVPAALLGIAFLIALLFLLGAQRICVRQDRQGVALAGDQAYIDLLYAHNISSGLGPRYLPDHPKTLAPASSLRVALLCAISTFFSDQSDLLWSLTLLGAGMLWLTLVMGALWLRHRVGEGSEIGFLLLTLTHGGILWLLWSGDPDASIALLSCLCAISLYGKPLTTGRLFTVGVSGFLLGLCGWAGYAYSIGASLFLWTAAPREKPALRNPFQPAFWAAALPLLGGGSLLFVNWAWTGVWDGGGPVARLNPLGSISPQAILRLDWSRGLLDVFSHFGSLGTPFSLLPWITLPVAVFGLVFGMKQEESNRAPTELLPLFQFLCLVGFLGFLPEERRQIEILPFLPVFLLFVIRGIRQLVRLIPPVQDTLAWVGILGLVVLQVWCLPNWYRKAQQQCQGRVRRAILPAEEIRDHLSPNSRIAAGDDPAFLWSIAPEFLANGSFGSGYRMRIELAGMDYAGVKRDRLRLLLEAPDAVVFPTETEPSNRSAFPDIAAASEELTAAAYEIRTFKHAVLFSRSKDVSIEGIRERAAQRLLRTGREKDLLWSVVTGDLIPGPTPGERKRWRKRIDNNLDRVVGKQWDFERGLPEGSTVIGEGASTGWFQPVPVDGMQALSTSAPKNFATIRSEEFTIEGDRLQLAVAGVGSATECFVSLLVWESTGDQSLQLEPVRKTEHFYHWSGQFLRGDSFFYLVPSRLSRTRNGWQGWRVVRTASPQSPRSWTTLEWPVHAWRGMRAMWEVCDRSTEGWIAVDHIRQILRPPGRYWDFEDGGYEGWSIEGNAFGKHPALGPFPGQQPISGQQGDFLVNTYLDGSDMAWGFLRSATFPIDHEFLRFRIGGGDTPLRTALNFYVNGQLSQSATGRRDEQLRTVTWDLRGVYGQEGQLVITDLETGDWGHVLVDDIALIDGDSL